VPAVAVSKNPVVRGVYLALGFLFLGIALISFVPLIPTTEPVLLAAFFFSRSSKRFDHWLESNALFGGIVRDWRAGAGFSIRGKTIAVVAIAVTFTITVVFVMDKTAWRVVMILLGLAIAAYVVTRPTKPAEAPATTS
jgi:uncharacterized protein